MRKQDTRDLERAAEALDLTHRFDNRGPKTFRCSSREIVAEALDRHIATGLRMPRGIMVSVRHLEHVIGVEGDACS